MLRTRQFLPLVLYITVSSGICLAGQNDDRARQWDIFFKSDIKAVRKSPESSETSEQFDFDLTHGRKAQVQRDAIDCPNCKIHFGDKYTGTIVCAPGVILNGITQDRPRILKTPEAGFATVKEAFQAQDGLSEETLHKSLLHPFLIDPASIKRYFKDKYLLAKLGDSAQKYKLAHTTRHGEDGFTQAYKARPHDFGRYEEITKDAFETAAKTSSMHCTKEVYEARTQDGSFVSIYCRSGNIGQPSYASYIDHWKNKWPENYRATFFVFKSVFDRRQAAQRALQAAKTEEAKGR